MSDVTRMCTTAGVAIAAACRVGSVALCIHIASLRTTNKRMVLLTTVLRERLGAECE